MSITVSRCAYENGVNNLRIEGVKSAFINELLNRDHTKCLYIGFDSTEDLQALQNELNNMFPENIKLDKKFTEPEEEGLYLTTTGTLLSKDTEGDWSVRRPTVEDGQFVTVPIDRVWSDGFSASYVTWPLVVATLGAEAFPLVPVKFA
jgi:hypothetical protein